MKRRGFTLVELLVAITIIGILGSISWAALARARQAANVANTKSTIARLHSQIQAKWDGYRTRKVPIDVQGLLGTLNGPSPPPQALNLKAFINALWINRGSLPPPPLPPALPVPGVQYDTLGIIPGDPRFPTVLHVAAGRLMAIRELQRYEMPSSFDDFAVVTGATAPYAMRPPQVLASAPAMSYTYLRKLNASSAGSTAQVQANESAECLYMVVTSGLEDVSFGGELSVPKSVGDADGDGLHEFQDAWTLGLQQFPSRGPQRQPISWIRWPAGFRNSATITVSDLDKDPTQPTALQFSMADHDYFDTLKVDVPAIGSARGFGMMPLVFSLGTDGSAGLSQAASPPPIADPYDLTSGAPTTGWEDNVHNHLIESR